MRKGAEERDEERKGMLGEIWNAGKEKGGEGMEVTERLYGQIRRKERKWRKKS